ncbi:ParB/RepB/Spo0J family partition protein [Gordonia sp. HY442]|uniref:ParB/RepB/Spo0J family partition protein n=1 Tax=Gordonia zhenghanii TaxID=2911516 RepID=UPI001F24FEAA|nr:ParB/RepB/Spo0J family partition protein [Gordonia zhenghanii]MCF8603732.1 ParB/RepB/Spo0J family partition protein [Gordonia zhenghanii]
MAQQRDTQRRGGLGRGLAALIPTGPTEENQGTNTRRMGSAAADVVIGGGAQPPTGTGLPVDTELIPSRTAETAIDVSRESTGSSSSSEEAGDGVAATGEIDRNEVGAVYREIPPSQIEPNPHQPRTVFDEDALAELEHSIREFGLMQPIVVRELPSPTADGIRYQLIMGERRWRAGTNVGVDALPAIVRETPDGAMLRDALLENIHRAQLNPLEEAAAYQQLLEEFDVTHEELANRLGRSRPVISNMIRLLRLPIPVQRRVAVGVLSAGHARALLALETGTQAQEELAARIVAEGLSVRATEEAVTLANRDDDGTPTATPRRRQQMQMPGLQDVADRLSDRLDTKVTVSLSKRKGKVVIEFGSVDDLERIVTVIAEQTDNAK